MKSLGVVVVSLAAVFTLSACAEREQVVGQYKPAGKSFDAPNDAFVAPGWKSGDAESWKEQLRQRTQNGQNEYTRAAGS